MLYMKNKKDTSLSLFFMGIVCCTELVWNLLWDVLFHYLKDGKGYNSYLCLKEQEGIFGSSSERC